MNSVAIVGTGLIGASFGLALKAVGFTGHIFGVSSQPAAEAAQTAGAIDSVATLEAAIPQSDLIYLAQPISRIVNTLRHLDPLVQSHALVTDAGSTKQVIVSTAQACIHRCQFLGGHPMAGKESRGAAAAEAGLFRGRPYILTPGDLETAAAQEFRAWLERIGAKIVVLGAGDHDHLVAFSSHLPQLASTALASVISEISPDSAQVAGPGLVDATRLALSGYDLWRDIVSTNAEPIVEALSAYIQKLDHLRENLRTRQLQDEFSAAAGFARQLRKVPKPSASPA
jgi:prephenate dehydrogenase